MVMVTLAAIKLGPSGISSKWVELQRRVVVSQMGFVTTGGSWYKFLPGRITPRNRATDMSPVEFSISFVRAVGYYLLVPVPFKEISFNKLPALPQMVVWYFLLLICFIPGCLYLLRFHFRSTAILFSYILIFTAAQALFTGNEGTAFRQRDTVIIFYFIPIAIGFYNLKGWLASRLEARFGPSEVSGKGGEVPDGIS
jgi:hypothetical protein